MTNAPTLQNFAANLSVPERVLLFCLASGTDWINAGVPHATAQEVMVLGLIERDHGANYRPTHQGRAVLSVLIGGRHAELD